MSFFSSRIPSRMLRCIWSSSLLSLLVCDNFSVFLVFHDLDKVLRSTGQALWRISLNLCLSHFFPLMIRLGLWNLGKNTTKVKCLSHHILLRVNDTHMTSHWWCQPWYLPGLLNKVKFLHRTLQVLKFPRDSSEIVSSKIPKIIVFWITKHACSVVINLIRPNTSFL